jgi:acetyl/propionyl-CoA carboxylase alpha subunit
VEFILDENNNYYFLEMNTRLQVEHPVTEMITGIDLVKEQVKIAEGEKLPFRQEDLRIHGHAIELRIYAEDPANNFLPYTGKLHSYQRPQGPGIRVDDGFEEGMDIPVHYDPMIGKLIVHASNRQEAIQRMLRAIQEYKITGIENTLTFGKFVMEHPAFTSGKFDTHFVQKYFNPDKPAQKLPEDELNVAAAFAGWLVQNHKPLPSAKTRQSPGKWKTNRK